MRYCTITLYFWDLVQEQYFAIPKSNKKTQATKMKRLRRTKLKRRKEKKSWLTEEELKQFSAVRTHLKSSQEFAAVASPECTAVDYPFRFAVVRNWKISQLSPDVPGVGRLGVRRRRLSRRKRREAWWREWRGILAE